MQRTRTMSLMALAVSVPLAPVFGQDARGTVRTHVSVRSASMNGACTSLLNAPSELVRTPEGMTLLRLKKELDGVTTVVEQRGGESMNVDVRKLNETKRGVDSLMEVVVHYRSTRPSLELMVRNLTSQFSMLADAGTRAVNGAATTGYLGINLSGSQIRLVTDSGSFTAHCDRPMIEAVDVGSPARRAGLEAGDTVLAYNGRDILGQVVNYPQLLVPGNVVKVRIRREGKSREVPVTVGDRPAEYTMEFTRILPAPDARSGGGMFLPRVTDAPVVTSRSWAWEMPSMASISRSATMGDVLGAQLNAVDDEFAQRLGLEPGVLVLRVQAGSPSAEAGLRPGEMIRAVNGFPIRELGPILRAIAVPGARDVKLTVTGRDMPARIVTVKW